VEQQSIVKGIWDTTTSEKVIAPIVDWSGGLLKPRFPGMAWKSGLDNLSLCRASRGALARIWGEKNPAIADKQCDRTRCFR
jgi:hypothetical protein